jgi:proteasome lid subunit RPN8/RPN11
MAETKGGLALGAELRERLIAHAARVYPAECCGLLLGRPAPRREVLQLVEAENVAAAPRATFELAPSALLEAERLAATLGLEVLGVYHSHPSGPSWPSARDSTAPSWSQVVVSGSGEATVVRSFRGGDTPAEEALE